MQTSIVSSVIRLFIKVLNFLTPLSDLAARLWIAYIFFGAGLLKLQSWETTLSLFTYEYHVPLLSPYLAALIGTCAELALPILLVLGLGGRFFILVFCVYNAMAAISYPFLWTPEGAMGLQDHINWGLILLLLACHGSGKLSMDHWLRVRRHHKTI